MDTPVIGKRLRDVITLEYAAHAFNDCWKLSLYILYFCSKSSKKLDFISKVYDNIKSSSEGGCRLIQKGAIVTLRDHLDHHSLVLG